MTKYFLVLLLVLFGSIIAQAENVQIEQAYSTDIPGVFIDLKGRSPIVASFSNDNEDQLLFCSTNGTIFVRAVETGLPFGQPMLLPADISIPGISTTNPTVMYGTPCVGDFNGDGYLDIAITRPT